MCSSESRAEVMKPLVIKAGISAAFSIAAYLFAKSVSKRSILIVKPSSIGSQENHLENVALVNSESFTSLNHSTGDDLQNAYITNLEHKLVELESQLEYVENTKFDIQSRYIRYRALKEKEFMLMKIRNEMLMEKTRAEFMLKEIHLAEAENDKIGGLAINFIELFSKFQGLKRENVLLRRKARKMSRRATHRLMTIRQLLLSMKLKDEKLRSNLEEIESRDCDIQDFEEEIKQLKEVIDHLQREKIELTNKVDLVEKSHASSIKVEIGENVANEEHEKTLNKELEQLRNDQETQANEITYLKWSNACLRHELMRYHEQRERNKELQDHEIIENSSSDIVTNNDNYTSKRRRFIKKIKKWVDGGHQTDDKQKIDEIKCFGNSSVHEVEAEDVFVRPRISCSSV